MYVLSEVSAGRPFSRAVREAVERGYAEPDPRDDLSGRDAARKGLILARMIGYRGAGPVADDLVPAAYRHLPLAVFLDRLPELDDAWQKRVAVEAARGRLLRYVVSATPRKVSAGLLAVPATSPMGAAGGTRNIVTFHSRRYLTRAAGDQRSGRRRRRHRRRIPQRHLFAGGVVTNDELLRLILTSRVYDVARQTPLDAARRLSQRTGHEVFLKREDLQPIFTYKIRGAYNRIAHLSAEERQRGVITASAGNHAQGVAYAATASWPRCVDRHAADDAGDQDRRGAPAGRDGRALRRQLQRCQAALRRDRRRDRNASSFTRSTIRW